MASFEQTSLNTVHRKGQRGAYDHATVHTLIDTTPVLHVAFNDPTPTDGAAFPVILPMLGCTGSYSRGANPDAQIPDDSERSLYLHGYVSARLMKLPEKAGAAVGDGGEDGEGGDGSKGKGVPVTVSATSLDGIILALTPFNHSCNYRSAVVFGRAKIVEDEGEKKYATHRITNNLVPGRWDQTRLPTKAELTSTGIIRVDIVSGSAKIHVGGPGDDKKDLRDEGVTGRVWTGVVPTWTAYGPLMEGNDNKVTETPEYLKEWVEREQRVRKEEAFESLKDEKGVMGVKVHEEAQKGWFG